MSAIYVGGFRHFLPNDDVLINALIHIFGAITSSDASVTIPIVDTEEDVRTWVTISRGVGVAIATGTDVAILNWPSTVDALKAQGTEEALRLAIQMNALDPGESLGE